jgi:hypothetical protein
MNTQSAVSLLVTHIMHYKLVRTAVTGSQDKKPFQKVVQCKPRCRMGAAARFRSQSICLQRGSNEARFGFQANKILRLVAVESSGMRGMVLGHARMRQGVHRKTMGHWRGQARVFERARSYNNNLLLRANGWGAESQQGTLAAIFTPRPAGLPL